MAISNLLSAKELKEKASITDLLSKLGYQPLRKSGKEQIYLSMLRDSDTKPSFAVNDELGMWFDHGTGKGGNIIDFGLAYWKHLSFSEVVEKIQLTSDISAVVKPGRPRKAVKIPHYVIEHIKELGTHPAITRYLKGRGIFQVAVNSMKEVYYRVDDQKGQSKYFFAAGWKNENGSWEVRNLYFKGCLGHKGMTFMPGDEKKLVVFEGYMNYLSWKVENPVSSISALIINSLSLLGLAIERAKAFTFIDLYLDRDHAGFAATKAFIKALPYASDRSVLYQNFNDYNDKIVASMPLQKVDETQTIKKSGFSY
jgi:hypothetical protein